MTSVETLNAAGVPTTTAAWVAGTAAAIPKAATAARVMMGEQAVFMMADANKPSR
ncbi:MAG: hypothetical protein KDG57_15910 [Rhodoferax sp.]|nr:hypothetical protein [Rhodoferax sp.]